MGMKAEVNTGKGDTMHSHDRTMISKMGFCGADRKNSNHDLACEYLASDEEADVPFPESDSHLNK